MALIGASPQRKALCNVSQALRRRREERGIKHKDLAGLLDWDNPRPSRYVSSLENMGLFTHLDEVSEEQAAFHSRRICQYCATLGYSPQETMELLRPLQAVQPGIMYVPAIP